MIAQSIIPVTSIIQPKRPASAGWRRATWWQCPPGLAALGYPVVAWEHAQSGLFALSAGERCSSADAVFVLAAFDLSDAKEDNHIPNGKVRNFWRPVADHLSGYECPCVEQEPAMVENKGDFVWRGLTP